MARLGRAQPFTYRFKAPPVSPAIAGPYTYVSISSDNSDGGVAWDIPGAAGSIASWSGGTSLSQYLKFTGFPFNINRTSSIAGIVATLNMGVSGSAIPMTCRLIKGFVPRVMFQRQTWNPAGGTIDFGSSLDSWGEPWTPDEINAEEFGVVLRKENTDNTDSLLVMGMTMTVYTTTTALPVLNYAPDTYNFGPTAVTVGATSFSAYLDATLLTDPAVSVTLTIEISYDNGSTWKLLVSGSGSGASVVGPSGVTEPRWWLLSNLPQTADANTFYRGSLIITGDSLVTGIGVYMA